MTEPELRPSRRKVAAGIGIALFLIIAVSAVSYNQLVLVPSQSLARTGQPEETSQSVAEENIPEEQLVVTPETIETPASPSASIALGVDDSKTPWSFRGDKEANPTIRLKQGQTIEITFINDGNTVHDFTIEELGITADTTFVEPGAEVKITIKGENTGVFTYFCAQPGHRDLGMFGELIVE